MDGNLQAIYGFPALRFCALLFVGFRQSGWGHGYVPCVECLHSICTCSLALPAALNYGLITAGA